MDNNDNTENKYGYDYSNFTPNDKNPNGKGGFDSFKYNGVNSDNFKTQIKETKSAQPDLLKLIFLVTIIFMIVMSFKQVIRNKFSNPMRTVLVPPIHEPPRPFTRGDFDYTDECFERYLEEIGRNENFPFPDSHLDTMVLNSVDEVFTNISGSGKRTSLYYDLDMDKYTLIEVYLNNTSLEFKTSGNSIGSIEISAKDTSNYYFATDEDGAFCVYEEITTNPVKNDAKVTITLPRDADTDYLYLIAETFGKSLEVENFDFMRFYIKNYIPKTTKIDIEDCKGDTLIIDTMGNVDIKNLTLDTFLKISSLADDIKLSNVETYLATIDGTSCDLRAKNLTVEYIETNMVSGDQNLEFRYKNKTNINLFSVSGDIHVTLDDDQSMTNASKFKNKGDFYFDDNRESFINCSTVSGSVYVNED